MPDNLTIRGAEPGDLPALLDLYRHLNPGDSGPSLEEGAEILERFSRYEGSTILIGLSGDMIVATCALIVVPNLTRGGAPYGLIENVVTDARYRKRGYGKALLTEAIAAAWRCKCYKVMLLTGSDDPATHRFYGEIGFEQSKTGFQMRRIAKRPDWTEHS